MAKPIKVPAFGKYLDQLKAAGVQGHCRKGLKRSGVVTLLTPNREPSRERAHEHYHALWGPAGLTAAYPRFSTSSLRSVISSMA